MTEVKNLTKRYGAKVAVNNIDFTVNDGEILGFLGPNGAGKSTTMNIITGYLSSTEGNVEIDGVDILNDPLPAKKKIGYLPEQPPLYLDMTVKDYLNFVFDLKKVKLKRADHIEQICQLVQIENVFTRLIKNLSKGYKQRVGLAQALIGNPEVLVLDEPTVGLDPNQIIEIRNLIKSLSEKHTIILSSHILSEVQATCDRIVVISNGQIVADDTTENLSKNLAKDDLYIARIEGPKAEIRSAIQALATVKTVKALDGEKEEGAADFEIHCKEGLDVRRELFKKCAERDWPILELRGMELTLEQIFLKLTSGDISGALFEPEKIDKKDKKHKDEQDGEGKETLKNVTIDGVEDVDLTDTDVPADNVSYEMEEDEDSSDSDADSEGEGAKPSPDDESDSKDEDTQPSPGDEGDSKGKDAKSSAGRDKKGKGRKTDGGEK